MTFKEPECELYHDNEISGGIILVSLCGGLKSRPALVLYKVIDAVAFLLLTVLPQKLTTPLSASQNKLLSRETSALL